MISELKSMATTLDDFSEKEIIDRNSRIFNDFISFLDREGLIEQ